jgi:hypothetical protein
MWFGRVGMTKQLLNCGKFFFNALKDSSLPFGEWLWQRITAPALLV